MGMSRWPSIVTAHDKLRRNVENNSDTVICELALTRRLNASSSSGICTTVLEALRRLAREVCRISLHLFDNGLAIVFLRCARGSTARSTCSRSKSTVILRLLR